MDNLSDYTEQRAPEFQVVIIVDFDDGRMFPLTDECPKCLLPIGNRKLIAYQLDLVAKSGGTEVFLVSPREYEAQLGKFLKDYSRSGMKIDLVGVDEMMGSADGLRAVADRIRGDFVCLSTDFICQFTLGDVVQQHRLKTSDLTMMFSTLAKGAKRDEVDEEYVGITGEGRVVFKSPTLEIDGEVALSKALLHRTPGMSMRGNLSDMGVYVMSHWVIEFVKANHRISSIRSDLVPYFVKRQFQPASYLYEKMPALQHRHRPLHDLEAWLVNPDRAKGGVEMLDSVLRSMRSRENTSGSHTPTQSASSAATSVAIGVEDDEVENKDLLRCFAVVYDCRQPPSSTTATTASASGGTILTRITNIQSYMAVNRDLPLHSFDSKSPWTRLAGYQKKETSVVGEGTDLISSKSITFKQCTIGTHCIVGQNTKLNNCIIMDGVTIGDNCTIQNCVIGDRAVVEAGCNLNECHLGHGYRVPAGTKAKNELYSAN